MPRHYFYSLKPVVIKVSNLKKIPEFLCMTFFGINMVIEDLGFTPLSTMGILLCIKSMGFSWLGTERV